METRKFYDHVSHSKRSLTGPLFLVNGYLTKVKIRKSIELSANE